jgi:2-iminobutanoate/2-iminopropanoate deaminase
MREMEFKMERPGLLKEGDHITVTEGVLPSNYYYTIDPSLAMSGNYPFRERMLEREGVVTAVIENARGYYVKASTDKAPAAIGPYSQGIIAGDFLFASGQIPIDPATGNIKGSNITEQAEQVMKNVGAILSEAGTDYTKVVKTTCFLAEMADFAAFNAVYEKYFTEKPARSCVAVKQLPKDVLCEVEVTAYLNE